ncbi:unnamed protein product [Haemonchus placei]|uniref:Bestrophin homolog n=1 Tax=Haemonchus placei TaxID=6290 RepID=A0A158QRK4_HAEPC|nr:unnamed protein product [Haemonchus placei]
MTISYSGNFFRLLLRWKGSLWRSVWRELLVYIALFYAVKLFYLVGIDYLSDDSSDREMYRRKFEALCRMFNEYTRLIPLTFLLGFYVSNEDCETVRWMAPLHWIQHLIVKEEKENNPPAAFINNFMTELRTYRQSLRKLFCYDWVCVPLVYTQVTALATYSFFFFTLFGRQVLHSEVEAGRQIDSIIPLFAVIQFMFLVGWFKVGQDLMRPFGLDDDDIELNYILDRNFKTSFAVVNRLHTSD